MKGHQLVFFDLETTGLEPTEHAIIEIAAIAVQLPEYKEVGDFHRRIAFGMLEIASPYALWTNSFSEMLDPGFVRQMQAKLDAGWEWPETVDALPDELQAGFRDAHERWNVRAISTRQAEREFSRFLKNHATIGKLAKRTGKPYYVAQLAAHNADKFDMPMLRAWYDRLEAFPPFFWLAVDTMKMAHQSMVYRNIDYPNLKLETLAQFHGVLEGEQQHDALTDVRLMASVAKLVEVGIAFDVGQDDAETAAAQAREILANLPAEMRQMVYEEAMNAN